MSFVTVSGRIYYNESRFKCGVSRLKPKDASAEGRSRKI
jgi:hypothetical protein